MNVRTIGTLNDFLAIKDQYLHQVTEGEGLTPFYTHRWLEACWRCLQDDDTIRLFCLFSDETLVAVVPTKFQLVSRWGVKIWFGSILGIHLAPFNLASNGMPDGWEHFLVRWLFSRSLPRWTLFKFGPLIDNSVVRELLPHVLKEKGLPHEVREFRYHHLLLQGTWENFLQNQSKHFRRTLHVKERDAFVKGGLRIQRVKNPTRGVLQETVFRVSEKSWQGQQGLAVASTDVGRKFYECLANGDGEFDVHLTLISDGETCVSYLLGLVRNKVYHAFDTGFDPEYSRYSLGYLAVWLTIRGLFEEGMAVFDYGLESQYEERYDFEHQESVTLVLFRNHGVAATVGLWRRLKSLWAGSLQVSGGPENS